MTTSRCVRTDLYSSFQAHMVEATCKQQKWRRKEEEDATKTTCGIQTHTNFLQQKKRQNVSKRYLRSIHRSQTVSLHGFRHAHNFEDDVSIDYDVTATTSSLPLTCSNSDEQFCHTEDEGLSTECGGFIA